MSKNIASGTIVMLAFACGMGDTERLRRSFIRRMGVNPGDCRRRFERRDERNIH